MNAQEMDHIITQATSTFALGNPSEYIISLNPLLNTTEGRKFLASQHGEKGLALVELLDWVSVSAPMLLCPIAQSKIRRVCKLAKSLSTRDGHSRSYEGCAPTWKPSQSLVSSRSNSTLIFRATRWGSLRTFGRELTVRGKSL